MQTQKESIRQSFQKAKPTYAQNAIIQKEMQQTLLQILAKQNLQSLDNVLELGCGNGLLCQKLIQLLDFKSLLAVDLVDFSCDFAKIQKNTKGKIVFLQADFENLAVIKNLKPTLKYDLIISNAAIQWVDQKSFLPKLNTLLNTNGFLIFSTFGKENYKELHKFFNIGLEYLKLEEYQKILGTNFKILESFEFKIPLHFPNTLEVFRHLQSTGVNSLKQGFLLNKTHLKEYEKQFGNVLTYHCLYLAAQKCES